MVSKISDVLIETVSVGDPPVNVTLGKMTVDVRKKLASDIVREKVSSHIGGLKISGQLDVPDSTCVVSQVGVSSEYNNFIFGDHNPLLSTGPGIQ